MKGLIIGGDARFPELCRLLSAEGHYFFPLAMEKVLPVEGPPDYFGAEALILPLPAERGGRLNAPYSVEEHSVEEYLEKLRKGTVVFAGMAGEALRRFCQSRGLILIDYFESEAIQLKNALLTAEGALAMLLTMDGKALCGRRVLISGFGRIARLLAPRLAAMGMEVTVVARSGTDRALAEAMGFRAVKLGECTEEKWDFVVNTVPAVIFGRAQLEAFGDAQLLELASPPYGFDIAAAEELGKQVVLGAALPSRFAPESAAQAIKDSILGYLEE